MKGIGAFVLLLVIGLGAAFYVVSRPPERELDAQGQAWVASFRAWSQNTARQIDDALVGMDFGSEAKNKRLIAAPLLECSATYAKLGEPPEFLADVQDAARDACGRAEYAVSVNDRFGEDSLATIKLHLSEAGDRITLARRTFREELASG